MYYAHVTFFKNLITKKSQWQIWMFSKSKMAEYFVLFECSFILKK